ncbi:unnamed protein product [Dicrocoelium dendriticum]|nr:unnamed protein product [Dicrocoelium dendriticum]
MPEEILPTVDYPPTIRGSLRLMLQLKDALLGSFNLVEEYRDQLLACKHGFTRSLVVYQLTKGLASITRLREDLANVEAQAESRLKRNLALREYLLDKYSISNDKSGSTAGIVSRIGQNPEADPSRPGTGTAVLGNAIPPPLSAPDSVEQALHGGMDHYKGTVDVDVLDVPEEIDLATTTTGSGTHLLPVVEFYRGFFFLQMHFQIIMCQAANYAMPVVTRPMTLSERAFAWPTIPSFGLASTTGAMKDRLLEIHTDVVALATRLTECLALVREKMVRDRKIESYFMQHTAAQEALRRNLLRNLQAQRVYIECLETQNDRLAGLAIKIDPNFAKSADFLMMTGSGAGFQNTVKPNLTASNQNSMIVSSRVMSQNREDSDDDYPGRERNNHRGHGGSAGFEERRYEDEYKDHRSANGSRGREFGKAMNRNEMEKDDPENVTKRRITAAEPSNSNYELNVQDANMNYSASGGGRPPIWVHQGTLTSRTQGYSKSRNDYKQINLELDATQNLEALRGNSQAVEELLIGVDSVAFGRRRPVDNLGQLPSPSFLNTEHYVTSICDDVFRTTPYDGVSASNKSSAHSIIKSNGSPGALQPMSASTRSSEVELMGSVMSDAQPAVAMVSKQSDNTIKSQGAVQQEDRKRLRDSQNIRREHGPNAVGENSSEAGLETDATDDTLSEMSPRAKRFEQSSDKDQIHPSHLLAQESSPKPVDTNVNASDIVLPRLVSDVKRSIPRVPCTAKQTMLSTLQAQTERVLERNQPYAHPRECESAQHLHGLEILRPKDRYGSDSLRNASERCLRQVPAVGVAECGHLCMPEWIAKREEGKVYKVEDLLEEPKRSALSKAMLTHRCRLVETILQADEDRLEEIISVLLKD